MLDRHLCTNKSRRRHSHIVQLKYLPFELFFPLVMYQIEEHLAPLPAIVTNSFLNESISDDDSCVEITSLVDENDLIKWTTYLQLNSVSDEDSDENCSSTQPASLVNYSLSESSSDDENLVQS
ncbi:unnamed protein product [Adineta ricciae]|uniref:Uncharacterized protein n=1 Tax=Adineta ricciae TaxID=249248 RepID=A0A816HNC9_ADIRI|nr:unnamed protein product [Adineta ricciae]